ncbi:sugar diacid recognition domain-containing protein [Metabacillus dongyingensis]|uniref:CdaR family transcriptional regulator n=1 Tax=Metabacillus dongyingensis TaxID=2874282 RepID=UPI003B8CAD9C
MIRPSLAKSIILEMNHLIDEDLIVADTSGTIIASTDESRVGTFHEGAQICCREQRKLIITERDQKVLAGVKAGINLPIFFHNQIAGVIGITGDPDRVFPFGEILRKMTELLMNERYYLEQLEWRARAIEAFVFDWIHRSEWSEAFLNQAELLGIDLSLNRQIIIVHFTGRKDALIGQEVLNDIMQTFMNESTDVFVRWGNDRFVILHAAKEKKDRTRQFAIQISRYLSERYHLKISIGVGQPSAAAEVYRSFEQAERALTVAKNSNSIVFDEELRLELLLKDIKKDTREEFVRRTIATIIQDQELLDTLKTFLIHNQSFKHTADNLHIHINTLHYRLKRIEQLTGLNPRHSEDLTALYLAFSFLDDYPNK